MNKVTINPNSLDDFSVDTWAINQDPEVGKEEPEQVTVEHKGRAYILNFLELQKGISEIYVEVRELLPNGDIGRPLKTVIIEENE